MPTISKDRKDQLAQLFMDYRGKDVYRESFSKDPFENLVDHLYRGGLIINSKSHEIVNGFATQFEINPIEASDFFKEVVSEVSERVSKDVRFKR